jgi:creatinine amidohydrolase
MTLPRRWWAEMTWTDFRDADVKDWIAVLPIAATEQHGPHLPLGTDTLIMQGYLDRVIAALPDDLPATVLPVQAVGLSPEHGSFPGTLTLTPETALRSWIEIAGSVQRAGVRKLVIVSSHGGNNALMDVAAREMRVRFGLLAVTTAFARFGVPDGMFPEDELSHGIHAGAVETSLMQAFRGDLVRSGEVRAFASAAQENSSQFQHLRLGRPAGYGWLAEDLNADGALGDAGLATAGRGEVLAGFGVAAFVELLREVGRFELPSVGP